MEIASMKRSAPHLLAAVAAATVVLGLPTAAVIALEASGTISSLPLLLFAAVALSAAVSQLGAVAWKRSSLSGSLLFDDLMPWGWLRRWRVQRALAEAPALVDSSVDSDLEVEKRRRRLARLSRALEARDRNTHGHSRRVARHSVALAKWLSLPPEEVARVRTAALLHDVGKIETPQSIIEKPGPLTGSEYATVKEHVELGASMVSTLGDPELTAIVRHHHERVDGTGYPDGLAGEEVPLGARIVAVADTFDAVTSARPYRAGMTHKEALALVGEEAGGQLDPGVARVFCNHYSRSRRVALWAAALTAAKQLGEALLPRIGAGAGATKAAATAAAIAALGGATAVQPPPPTPLAIGPTGAPASASASTEAPPHLPSRSGQTDRSSAKATGGAPTAKQLSAQHVSVGTGLGSPPGGSEPGGSSPGGEESPSSEAAPRLPSSSSPPPPTPAPESALRTAGSVPDEVVQATAGLAAVDPGILDRTADALSGGVVGAQ
jgi:putative nucleotidyltransferase with HDIG domain